MSELQTYTRPDNMQDIENSDLVQVSRKLLDKAIMSTDAFGDHPMTPERMIDLKLVLAFLKATNNMINAKLHYFQLQAKKEMAATQAVKQAATDRV